MKHNFDKVINRKNTNSLKYDCAEKRGKPNDLLPMWVADMDFACPKKVGDVLSNKAKHGIFGYSEPSNNYFNILSDWLGKRHGYTPKEEWLVHTPGIVFAITIAIKAFTNEQDAVLIQKPVYYPFSSSVINNNRKLINNPLILNKKTNQYEIDFVDFENKIKDNKVKLFILCSPHNPVGRVWEKDELRKMGEICKTHNCLVFSDEIHADFIYPEFKHTVFTNANDIFLENSIVAFSPSKTFNLAGLQFSDIFIADKELREKFKSEYGKSGYAQINTFGIVAAEAAYKYGENWVDSLNAYLCQNVELIDFFIKTHIPKVKFIKPQGTYLAWLDFSKYNLSQIQLDDIITNKAKLWLSSGTVFGSEGNGFMRLNFACPKKVLLKALESLKEAFANL